MKSILLNKIVLAIIGGIAVIGIGVGIYFGTTGQKVTETDDKPKTTNNKTTSSDDFQRTGQNSFGVSVCDEITASEVSKIIGKTILKAEDYSSASTGCEYFVTDTSFVIINVSFSDMETQKTGLLALDRTIKTDSRIKLENMLAYSEKGLIDIYMNIAPGKKYVRVGRSSLSVVDEETLIQLAIATEAKIRSFKN